MKSSENGFSLLEVLISLVIAAVAMIFLERIASGLAGMSRRFETTAVAIETDSTVRMTLRKLIENATILSIVESQTPASGQSLLVSGRWPPHASPNASDDYPTDGRVRIFLAKTTLWLEIEGYGSPEAVVEGVREVSFNLLSPTVDKTPADGEVAPALKAKLVFLDGSTQEFIVYGQTNPKYCSTLTVSGACHGS